MTKKIRARRLKNFFQKVREFFQQLFSGIDNFIANTVRPTILFLEALKTAIQNPSFDILTDIIPGNIDNKVLELLRKYLPVVIKKLNIVVSVRHINDDDYVKEYIKLLRESSPALRSALIFKTASLLIQELDGKKFDEVEIDTLVQFTYNQIIEEKEA
jgi:hypothetical protein